MDFGNYILPRKGTFENPLRLAVLISGSGSGMAALLAHQKNSPSFHLTTLVFSNIAGVTGLKIAQKEGVKTEVAELDLSISDKKLRREKHEEKIMEILLKNKIELVILSGYMRILTPKFVEKWMGRLLNIHPSLLPHFPGAHAHQEVLNAGVNESGCTVHFVDTGVDTGLIIAQEKVKVFPTDKLEDLQNRIKKYEHKIYPKVIDALSEGRIKINKFGEVTIQDL